MEHLRGRPVRVPGGCHQNTANGPPRQWHGDCVEGVGSNELPGVQGGPI